MKKIFVIIAISVFCIAANAQGTWTAPQQDGQQKERRGLFDKPKSEKIIAPKYLVGGVPEENGKVVWAKQIPVEGKNAAQIYGILLPYFQNFVKGSEQTELSRVSVVNEELKEIYVRPVEWLVFENKPLSLDQTKFIYNIGVKCKDGAADVRIFSIRYIYEEGRPGAMSVSAEEWISDSEALNKKKTGFHKGGVKKFRMKTIDRVEEIFNGIEEVLK